MIRCKNCVTKHLSIVSSQGPQTVGKHNISSSNFVDRSKVSSITLFKFVLPIQRIKPIEDSVR